MMASETDRLLEDANFPRDGGSNYHGRFAQHNVGKGKGKGRHRHDSTAQLEDFISQDMFVDPWIELYARLPDEIRRLQTRHLTDSEMKIVDRFIEPAPSNKRPALSIDNN